QRWWVLALGQGPMPIRVFQDLAHRAGLLGPARPWDLERVLRGEDLRTCSDGSEKLVFRKSVQVPANSQANLVFNSNLLLLPKCLPMHQTPQRTSNPATMTVASMSKELKIMVRTHYGVGQATCALCGQLSRSTKTGTGLYDGEVHLGDICKQCLQG